MLKFNHKTLKLRLFSEKDIPFLKEVYFSTREPEMKQLPHWSEAMKNAFLEQQFQAQHSYYQNNYVEAKFWVLENKNERIGRLYYDENVEDTIRIIDIALLPQFQNKGLGTMVLNGIFVRATEIQKPVSIHVERFNPAKKLYERLGFKMISETNGVYHLMEWKNN